MLQTDGVIGLSSKFYRREVPCTQSGNTCGKNSKAEKLDQIVTFEVKKRLVNIENIFKVSIKDRLVHLVPNLSSQSLLMNTPVSLTQKLLEPPNAVTSGSSPYQSPFAIFLTTENIFPTINLVINQKHFL